MAHMWLNKYIDKCVNRNSFALLSKMGEIYLQRKPYFSELALLILTPEGIERINITKHTGHLDIV